jgi:hypothetical protein
VPAVQPATLSARDRSLAALRGGGLAVRVIPPRDSGGAGNPRPADRSCHTEPCHAAPGPPFTAVPCRISPRPAGTAVPTAPLRTKPILALTADPDLDAPSLTPTRPRLSAPRQPVRAEMRQTSPILTPTACRSLTSILGVSVVEHAHLGNAITIGSRGDSSYQPEVIRDLGFLDRLFDALTARGLSAKCGSANGVVRHAGGRYQGERQKNLFHEWRYRLFRVCSQAKIVQGEHA